MADLAVGHINGVSKEADLTAVQMSDRFVDDFRDTCGREISVDALAQIADDIVDKQLGDKAVVLMAWGYLNGDKSEADRDIVYHDTLKVLLDHLDSQGVSLVTSTTNSHQCNVYPCAMGDPENVHYVPNLITVGAGLVNDGSYLEEAQHRDGWITVYGPGDDQKDCCPEKPGMLCAASTGEGNSEVGQSGASHGKQSPSTF